MKALILSTALILAACSTTDQYGNSCLSIYTHNGLCPTLSPEAAAALLGHLDLYPHPYTPPITYNPSLYIPHQPALGTFTNPLQVEIVP
jgi:hypothetical protein